MNAVNDIVRLGAQQQEILKRVANGSLSAKTVRRIQQQLIEGEFSCGGRSAATLTQLVDVSQLLLPLEEQLERIRYHNRKTWNSLFSKKELDGVDLESRHTQSIEDLEVIHIEREKPGLTMELLWAAISDSQPKALLWNHVVGSSLTLHFSYSQMYKPGIHRVRLNLVANWSDEGMSTQVIRERATQSGEKLAHGEALSALAWHHLLLRQMDGNSFPFMNLAGYGLWGADEGSDSLMLWWDNSAQEVKMFSDPPSEGRLGRAAAPLILS